MRSLHALAVVLAAALFAGAPGCGEDRPAEAAPPAAEDPGPAPGGVGEIMSRTAADARQLRLWAARRDLAPALRVASLRRLEEVAPAEAVPAAIALVHDPEGLVRVNAIALLARSEAPDAKAAIAGLNERDRKIAESIVRPMR